MKRAMCAFLLVLFACCGCNAVREELYVAKVGSISIYEPEFRFYFLLSQNAYESEGGADIWLTTIGGVKAEEVAKERAFASVTRVKVSGMQASSLGIALDDEDKLEAAEMSDYYMETLGSEDMAAIGMDSELMMAIMEETVIYEQVFDDITKNVEISEKDFDAFCENYAVSMPEAGDMEALKEALRPLYTQQIKSDFFDEQYSKWEADVQITKNDEVWNSIHILKH